MDICASEDQADQHAIGGERAAVITGRIAAPGMDIRATPYGESDGRPAQAMDLHGLGKRRIVALNR